MERFARLVMHHRRIVTAFWLLMFVGGLLSAGQLGSRWAFDFSLPGQAGDRAGQQLTDAYGVSAADTYIALDRFHGQFCADLPAREARLMGVTQRPITEAALTGHPETTGKPVPHL